MGGNKLKLGLIGLGNIGQHHLSYITKMPRVELVGVCDAVREKADKVAAEVGTQAYYSPVELFNRSGLDAVVIAVPHYDHVPVAIEAFSRGIHVLCEKPLAVHVNAARKVIDAYETAKDKFPNLVFAMMFNERTNPIHRKIKEIVAQGELGQLVRATWINTKWFRTQAYYDSGSWRATWAGEGGGILTNQCPHNLDMYQWIFGLPKRISGHAHIGKYHHIEVEDEVTAYFEHENGMIGHFIVSTAESPGTNRLEIVGENGKLVFEDGNLRLQRNVVSMLSYSRETDQAWGHVESELVDVPVDTSVPSGHSVITDNFVSSILDGGELIAEGAEGIKSVTLANGIMLSSFTGQTLEVPYDYDAYEKELEARIQTSKFIKTQTQAVNSDISKSFVK